MGKKSQEFTESMDQAMKMDGNVIKFGCLLALTSLVVSINSLFFVDREIGMIVSAASSVVGAFAAMFVMIVVHDRHIKAVLKRNLIEISNGR